MAVTRTTVVAGPAIVQFASYNFYSEGDITVTLASQTDDVMTSVYGKVDERIVDRSAIISFVPTEIEEASLPILWPYGSTTPGTSIFTTDAPLVIYTLAGKTITFTSAAVTKLPSLRLAASGTMLGAIEFTAIGKDNAEWSDAASIGTVASLAWTDPATYTLTAIRNDVYTASWAASGAWSSFTTEDGFSVDFNLSLKPIVTDAYGTIKMLFSNLEVMVKCKPLGAGATPIAEAELLAGLGWQDTGAARGRSLNAFANNYDMTITGAASSGQTPKQKLTFTLKNASMKTAGMQFGREILRNGEVGWIATRESGTGLYTVTLT